MKTTTEQQHKTPTASSTKGKAVVGLNFTKSGISTNKAAKQQRKTTGNRLVSLQSKQSGQIKISNSVCNRRSREGLPNELFLSRGVNCKGFSGQPLLSPTPHFPPAVPTSVQRKSSQCFHKFKLQLFPVDEVTRKGLEMEKHNPYLELTIGTRKKISSVVKHLNIKWGKSKMASGELMLFPYYARLENLTSHKRWTLKGSDTSAADVHAALGSPTFFRLRYGWFSNIKPKICLMPLTSPDCEGSLQINENRKKNTADDEKHPCSVSEEHEPAPADNSSNQGIAKSTLLDKTIQELNNQRTGNSGTLIWDLSNISFGALLSEASANVNANLVSCDSFDAAIASYKDTVQSAPVPESSILDAEETCNAFSFQKITSSRRTVPPQSKDSSAAKCIQNASSNPLRLHDALGSQIGHTQDTACQEPMLSLQLRTMDEACLQPKIDSLSQTQGAASEEQKPQVHTEAAHSDPKHIGKLDMYWSESLGPLEYYTPSSKQMIGGDSVGLGGLIASSLDAFQNFSIF